MAFPTVTGRNTGTYTTLVTTVAVAFDAAPAIGELLLVAFLYSGTANVLSVTSGTGWTKTAAQSANGGNPQICFFYKVADGVGDNLTVGLSIAARGAYFTRRISGGNYSGFTMTNGPSVTGGLVDGPAHAPGVGTKDFLWLTGYGLANVAAPTAQPAGYSNFAATIVSGTSQSMAIAEKSSNAASEDPGTWTGPVSPYVAWTLGVAGISGIGVSAATLTYTGKAIKAGDGLLPIVAKRLNYTGRNIGVPTPPRRAISRTSMGMGITLSNSGVTLGAQIDEGSSIPPGALLAPDGQPYVDGAGQILENS